MSATEIVIEGTLKPDGTLELDERPNMPAGRVTVVVRQEVAPVTSEENWWQCMQRIRAEREAAGYPFMGQVSVKRGHLCVSQKRSP